MKDKDVVVNVSEREVGMELGKRGKKWTDFKHLFDEGCCASCACGYGKRDVEKE